MPDLIIDSDYATDVDDLIAQAIALNAEALGDCKLLAMICASANTHGPGAIDKVNQFHGRYGLRIGEWKGNSGSYDTIEQSGNPGGNAHNYTNYVYDTYPGSGQLHGNYDDAVTVYRETLAAAADASVTIVTIGYGTTLYALLQSSGDSIDSRNGLDLVGDKVDKVVTMGSQADGSGEFNFQATPDYWDYIADNLPVPWYINVFEIGNGVFTPKTDDDNPGHIVSFAVRHYRNAYQAGTGTQSWDPLTVYAAIYGFSNFATEQGTLTVDPGDGTTTWTPGSSGTDTHWQVTPSKSDTEYENLIEPYIFDKSNPYKLYHEIVRADGPEFYFRMEETTGTQVADETVENALDLTGDYSLNVSGYSNPLGSAIDTATGVGMKGTVTTDTEDNPFRNDFVLYGVTMEAWIQPNSADLNGDDGGNIIDKDGNSGWRMRIENDGAAGQDKIRILTSINSTEWFPEFTGMTAFPMDGSWHHVVVTIDATIGEAKCYVDGQLADTVTGGPTGTFSYSGTSTVALAVGYDEKHVQAEFFDGLLDEIAVYGHVLSGTQVQAHYDAATYKHAFFDITNMPSDFPKADSVKIVTRYRGQNFTAETINLYAQLFESDEITPLSDEVLVATATSDTSFTNTSDISFTGVNTTADKTVWDSARIRLRWEDG